MTNRTKKFLCAQIRFPNNVCSRLPSCQLIRYSVVYVLFIFHVLVFKQAFSFSVSLPLYSSLGFVWREVEIYQKHTMSRSFSGVPSSSFFPFMVKRMDKPLNSIPSFGHNHQTTTPTVKI